MAPPLPPPGTRPTWRNAARRWIWRVLQIAALVYLGLMGILYSLQTWLIFPGAATQGRPDAMTVAPPGAELVTLRTGDGERIVALFGPALAQDGRPHPDASHRPSLLYFYGNAMCLRDTLPDIEQFRRLGMNVLVPEYVGYGMSSGRPSEQGCYASADAAYSYLVGRPDVDATKVVAGGWSLGGAVAIDLAVRRPLARVAVFSTFTSVADMARRSFPFLPISLLLRHRFDSLGKIPELRSPILIGHGVSDSLVPASMADQLELAAKVQVTRLRIERADHNDFFAVGSGKICTALKEFLEALSQPSG
jgi:uncharacterized protein